MKSIILLIISVVFFTSSSFSQIAGFSSLNPLAEKWAISLEGGATYTESDFKNPEFNYSGRLLTEYFFPTRLDRIFGLRAFANYGYLKGTGSPSGFLDDNGIPINEFKTTFILLGGGVTYTWVISNSVLPYVYTGASYLYFDPRDVNGNRLPNNFRKSYSRHEVSLQGEFGLRFLLAGNLSINFNGVMNYVPFDKLDDFKTGRDNDIFFSINGGLTYFFGGVKDSDKDGISDDVDVCPETPQGVKIDEFGCAVDTDNDGVPDYLDRCPQTRANIIVDVDGCPIDTDSDGIADYIDQCPNTPSNLPVDDRGCPFDKDKDGVPDYKDNCADTPTGTEVDKFGCPLESQRKELPKITQMILTGEVNFETGKSNLLPYANVVLNKVVTVLKENPDTRWRIDGHTDNTGSYEKNKKLSLERAWSVADYLISHGIEASRLDVNGLGPDYPVASNSTASGRAMNRRVTIEMTDGTTTTTTTNTVIPKVEKTETNPVGMGNDDSEYDNTVERNVGSMIFTDGKKYCIQLSSYRSHEKAVREVDKLQAKGENAYIVKVSDIDGLVGTWYRVRIGYFNTLQEARDHKADLN